MQLTVRIPDDDMAELTRIAGKLGLKRSELTRLALKKFLEQYEDDNDLRPFDKVKHLLGIVESGKKDLGSAHRRHIVKKIRGDL
ncbi:MAG: CopG family transcriptional regulator [Deltaproteobacteria bacterium]|nr:CopG family transcriptional regulator [Deltaproteobacteria bacterium]